MKPREFTVSWVGSVWVVPGPAKDKGTLELCCYPQSKPPDAPQYGGTGGAGESNFNTKETSWVLNWVSLPPKLPPHPAYKAPFVW